MSKMLDEIRQQPAALERTLRLEGRRAESLRRHFAKHRPRLVLLVARGTSDSAAQFGRYLIEIAAGIPVSLAAPSVFTLYGVNPALRDVLVVAVSQSGESTDTNFVLDCARRQGAATLGITNESGSTLAGLAGHLMHVRAGREKSVAATKTYSCQLLAMYLLAYALGAPVALDDLRRLPEWVDAALRLEPEIAARAERYRFMERALVIGRGLNYSNALEFALKLMETCYVVAERFSSADLLHGPIAMVERSFPAFLFAPAGVTWPAMRQMVEKLQALEAETLVITDRGNRDAGAFGPRSVTIPARLSRRGRLPVDVYTPAPYIVPAQLFAAHLAAEKGLNPDQPRMLSKVTRTL